jgi:uncharacterized protein (DUF885 family)
MTVEFRETATAAVEDWLANEPESATALGDHRYDDRLDDRSAEGLATKLSLFRRHRDALASTDPEALSSDDRADREILVGAFEERIFAIEELREIEWDPLVYNPGESIYPLLVRDLIPIPDRLSAIGSRLEQIPALLDLARRQLADPPRIHVETALLQNSGTMSLLDEVDLLLDAEPSMSATVEPAKLSALEALERHGVFLEELLTKAGGDFRLGAERFAKKLELTLNSSLDARTISSRADQHLEELTSDIEDTSRRYLEEVGLSGNSSEHDPIRVALDHVARVHPTDATVVDEARQALDKALDAVRSSGIVTLPDDEMVVQVMPEFRRGVAVAYCDAPGPLETGGQTFLAVAPTPESWTSDRVESFYREYNTAMLMDLIVHEAVPGHAVQLAHGRRFNASTPVRQVFMSGSFIEGWAVHAERLMAESGLGGLAVRLQQLKMQLRMTINAILDAKVHSEQMTENQALTLMTARGFQEEGEAAGKWRRACLTSAQLSTYFVGYTELTDVFGRLDTSTSHGYDRVLAHGSPPPRLLASLINES